LSANSFGQGAHKSKSINVELNLLGAWRENRDALEAQIRRNWTILLGIVAVTLVLGPISGFIAYGQQQKLQALASKEATLQKRKATLSEGMKGASPLLEAESVRGSNEKKLSSFLSNLAVIFESTPRSIALTNLRAEVLAGEMQIRLTAESESVEDSGKFIDNAGKGDSVLASIEVSSRRSRRLAAEGVVFEYMKRVNLEGGQ
jgi:hypothetical protein